MTNVYADTLQLAIHNAGKSKVHVSINWNKQLMMKDRLCKLSEHFDSSKSWSLVRSMLLRGVFMGGGYECTKLKKSLLDAACILSVARQFVDEQILKESNICSLPEYGFNNVWASCPSCHISIYIRLNLLFLSILNGLLSGTSWVSEYQNISSLDFIDAGWWRWWVVTTGAIRRAKLQPNCHYRQTRIQFFYRPDALPVAQPTVSEHWREMNLVEVDLTSLRSLARHLATSVCWHIIAGRVVSMAATARSRSFGLRWSSSG